MAKKNYGDHVKVYHGPVGNMPFDAEVYDGIYCYALLHLLEKNERSKLISDCYNQLKAGGYMVFVALSKKTKTYGEGKIVGEDQFLRRHGVKLFYYTTDSIKREFGKYGLMETIEINEPAKNSDHRPSQKFWKIICKKKPVNGYSTTKESMRRQSPGNKKNGH